MFGYVEYSLDAGTDRRHRLNLGACWGAVRGPLDESDGRQLPRARAALVSPAPAQPDGPDGLPADRLGAGRLPSDGPARAHGQEDAAVHPAWREHAVPGRLRCGAPTFYYDNDYDDNYDYDDDYDCDY